MRAHKAPKDGIRSAPFHVVDVVPAMSSYYRLAFRLTVRIGDPTRDLVTHRARETESATEGTVALRTGDAFSHPAPRWRLSGKCGSSGVGAPAVCCALDT